MEKVLIERGDHYSFDVSASKYVNNSGIILEKGKEYKITAEGIWYDWYIKSGPKGYDRFWMKPFNMFKRLPEAKWLSLLGAIDEKGKPFLLGKEMIFKASSTGEFFCFANDIRGFYANNSGQVRVKISLLD
ncbi:hypothetical protein [Aureibacter tunicatorum]|uniref:Uncharacterized protein n=1 Tax=Aureibacter tunicatorum TaxID=866807 RepID=A0AAE3XNN8_9BACT|nr:hypothetical protein [Aureibacter tunicatorum]MDR6238414.1 hypothetical protein [Aureibacter tunicatorum]BDD03446.1 hypothetical protein AUTU_09290 [Aureibacter tunicatorum]